MLKPICGSCVLAVLIQSPLAAQGPASCPPTETAAETPEATQLESLVVWRGTERSAPVAVTWTSRVCEETRPIFPMDPPLADADATDAEARLGVPDVVAIERLVRSSDALVAFSEETPILDLPPVLAGTRSGRRGLNGPRAVFILEATEDGAGSALHLIIEEASPLRIRVSVESFDGRRLQLAWTRTESSPAWVPVPGGASA